MWSNQGTLGATAYGWLRQEVLTGNLVSLSFHHMELRRVAGGPSLLTNTPRKLEGRSALSVGFRGLKGVLPSRHCLPQFPKKD